MRSLYVRRTCCTGNLRALYGTALCWCRGVDSVRPCHVPRHVPHNMSGAVGPRTLVLVSLGGTGSCCQPGDHLADVVEDGRSRPIGHPSTTTAQCPGWLKGGRLPPARSVGRPQAGRGPDTRRRMPALPTRAGPRRSPVSIHVPARGLWHGLALPRPHRLG
jgi:hypothetical protein